MTTPLRRLAIGCFRLAIGTAPARWAEERWVGSLAAASQRVEPNALAWLDRDVLAQPGVRWLILLEGINNLGTKSASAREVIAAHKQVITRSHARNIRAYGGTVMACVGSTHGNPALATAWQEINAWVRTSGQFDAVIDFDLATRDPDHLTPAVDGGDYFHPGPTGYRIIVDLIDLDLFRPTENRERHRFSPRRFSLLFSPCSGCGGPGDSLGFA